MLNIFSAIMAFFFSLTSFITVLTGSNLEEITVDHDPEKGYVWECEIADESIAVITDEKTFRGTQSFTVEGISEGRTPVTVTNKNGESLECILESYAEINPYNGETEYYQAYVLYDFDDYISYDEGITLTAEVPVDGGYWDFSAYSDIVELKSYPETENGICTFDVINVTLEDEKYAVLFTYYSPDGTPLENQFKAFTLTKDGKIDITPENRLAKLEFDSDFSKLITWTLSPASVDSETAEIISIYPVSDVYGSLYFPEDYPNTEITVQLIDMLLGKVPVGGKDVIVIEALKEGTAKFTLEKVDVYPIVKTDDGYTINTERYEILETVTVLVTVDSDLNISYEIK
ncbi:MAG: hypothetical protein IJE74_05650 [Clostridia bacterium]|nr:hypothetical protein [Clostridia bacterium]